MRNILIFFAVLTISSHSFANDQINEKIDDLFNSYFNSIVKDFPDKLTNFENQIKNVKEIMTNCISSLEDMKSEDKKSNDCEKLKSASNEMKITMNNFLSYKNFLSGKEKKKFKIKMAEAKAQMETKIKKLKKRMNKIKSDTKEIKKLNKRLKSTLKKSKSK